MTRLLKVFADAVTPRTVFGAPWRQSDPHLAWSVRPLAFVCTLSATLSGCTMLDRVVPESCRSGDCASVATVDMPSTAPSPSDELAWLPPPPQAADTSLPHPCRPLPLNASHPPQVIEQAFFPAEQQLTQVQCTEDCVDLRAIEKTLLERSNEIEQRLGKRIEALETELQQSRAAAATLQSQLDEATQQTTALKAEVNAAKLEVERINSAFVEQQAKDLESLEKLTDMLRILLVRPELVQQPLSTMQETK